MSEDMARICNKPSRGRYVQGCRCDGCTKANRDYNRKTRLHGFQSSFVDAEPVRRHVAELLSMGYSYNEIGRLSGVCDSTMRALITEHHRSGKPVKRINEEAARGIMAIDGRRRLVGHQLVDGRYVRHGVEKCVSAGMSVAAISRITGINRQVLDSLVHRRRQRITAKTLYAWVVSEPALRKAIKQLRSVQKGGQL